MFCEYCGIRANPHCGRMYKEKVRATKENIDKSSYERTNIAAPK
jgi:hypothetical protein